MTDSVEQNVNSTIVAGPPKKKSKVGRFFRIGGVILLLLILVVLIANALLSMFNDNYYTTFGRYRLFAIVSDSMEPEIPTGSMIVGTKPIDESEIGVGTVITYRVKTNKDSYLLTHRVTEIAENSSGQTVYVTKGDNAGGADSYRPVFGDVVGIYTGKKCGFFGALFGFFQTSGGVSVLIFSIFIIIVAWVVIWYVNRTDVRRSLETAALKKSAQALSTVNLRYDNIHEITAVMDVLGMVTDNPHSAAERNAISERLNAFIKAENIELPQTPETAAILDTLPAPDTPSALVAALSTGATLRQAEDGQTLVLTTTSGDKNIMLTPVQTQDGVILCQQGVRLRSDLAPNIEQLGAMSMPGSPEFFEGQSLEKAVIYPELPQPSNTFGPEMLLPHNAASVQKIDVSELPSPEPVKNNAAGLPSSESGKNSGLLDTASRRAYMQYREQSAALEIKQATQLSELLNETAPLTYDEQLRVAEYKAAHAKPARKKPSAPRTPEQREKAKQAAARKKAEREAFLNTLSAEDRELYLTEQKLAKSRASAIRKLKRMAADRKLLDKIGE